MGVWDEEKVHRQGLDGEYNLVIKPRKGLNLELWE